MSFIDFAFNFESLLNSILNYLSNIKRKIAIIIENFELERDIH